MFQHAPSVASIENELSISRNKQPLQLTAKVKLLPDPEQRQSLKETIALANEACEQISSVAWREKVFGKYNLQKLVYYDIREAFALSAQVVIRCIAKVADAYKKDQRSQRHFSSRGAIAYDARILRWYPDTQAISIWTVAGRQYIPFAAGEHQLELLVSQKGESKLAFQRGEFYLLATCEVEAAEEIETEDALGVDLGVVNLATDSDGELHSGSHVNSVRFRQNRLRKKLQSRGTRSAKRKLKQLSGKERRFSNDVNHCLAKQLVTKAQRTQRAIALEDLQGIRARIRARRQQRYRLHSWAFYDLQQKIKYKAERAGVPVIFVSPEYTSQACSCCGHVDKRNRQSQDVFLCIECGHAAHADVNAAVNIRSRAEVNPPNVAALGQLQARAFRRRVVDHKEP